ncbi:MAG: hypothetical protein L0H70_08170 [Xanthomonadales bacterium]|nr:hypothetical protein [Xanthomonadales bacterium]
MQRIFRVLGLAMAMVTGTVFAQTCASPYPLLADKTITLDTSTAANTLTMIGAVSSPGPDVVYSFVAAPNLAASSQLVIYNANFNWAVFLTTSCAVSATIVQTVDGGGGVQSGNLPLNDGGNPLLSGQRYYVIVTGNPNLSTDLSGVISMTTAKPLPVTLQAFSVR